MCVEDQPYDVLEQGNLRIAIYQDDYPENPRENRDCLGTMVCFHNRYNLGDKHDFDAEGLLQFLKDEKPIFLWLYLYDHSGITMSADRGRYPFCDMWDTSRVGVIYITKEKIRQEYSWKYLTGKRIAKILDYLRAEVEEYDNYLTGNCYGYITRCTNCEAELDSCWGFYGDDWDKNGLLDYAQGSECDCKSNFDI